MAVGVSSPLNAYFFRSQINKFLSPNFTESDANPVIVQFSCLGAATFVAAFCASVLMDLSSRSQLNRIRLKYFKVKFIATTINWFKIVMSNILYYVTANLVNKN